MKPSSKEARLRELLADQVLGGLSTDGRCELETLGGNDPRERMTYEIAAAAAHLAFVDGELEPVPAGLRARLSKMLTQG